MKNIATTTALATAFALGIAGAPFAQGVNPSSPSSAAGGTMAQGQTGGQMGGQMGSQTGSQTGQTGQRTQTGQAGQTPGQSGQAGQSGQRTQPGMAGQTPGQTGQAGQTGQRTQPGMGTGTATGMQPGQTGTQTTAEMSEDQIRSVLQARGYSDLSGIERDGEHFKVGNAKRYGRDVEDLRVNARTGQVRDEARLNESQVRKLLEDRGYSEISDVERDDDNFTAKAKRDDREVNLRVNAETGVVMPRASN